MSVNQTVSVKKIILALWLVFAIAGLSSVVFGPSGMFAMHQLEYERDRIAANMEKLRLINGELEGALESLRSDSDAVTVYARELGYAASPEERFVRVAGLPAAGRRTAQAGNLLKAAPPRAVSDNAIRVFAGLVGISVFIFVVSARIRTSRRRRPFADRL